MNKPLKKLQARFYASPAGREPVREWLKDLPIDCKRLIGADIATAEYGWPIGMPTCKSLGKNLFEIRTDLPDKTISRVIFSVVDSEIVLLHGFIKKTQKTPKHDMDLALDRLRNIEA